MNSDRMLPFWGIVVMVICLCLVILQICYNRGLEKKPNIASFEYNDEDVIHMNLSGEVKILSNREFEEENDGVNASWLLLLLVFF